MESRLIAILRDKGNTVHSISPETPVYECAKKMSELGIGALLVMQGEKLEGIVSERDIIRKLVASSSDIKNVTVADIMSKDLFTVPPSMTVTEAMHIVTEKRFRHLPVVENGTLIGIVSIGDLTRWAMLAQEVEISTLTEYIHNAR